MLECSRKWLLEIDYSTEIIVLFHAQLFSFLFSRLGNWVNSNYVHKSDCIRFKSDYIRFFFWLHFLFFSTLHYTLRYNIIHIHFCLFASISSLVMKIELNPFRSFSYVMSQYVILKFYCLYSPQVIFDMFFLCLIQHWFFSFITTVS